MGGQVQRSLRCRDIPRRPQRFDHGDRVLHVAGLCRRHLRLCNAPRQQARQREACGGHGHGAARGAPRCGQQCGCCGGDGPQGERGGCRGGVRRREQLPGGMAYALKLRQALRKPGDAAAGGRPGRPCRAAGLSTLPQRPHRSQQHQAQGGRRGQHRVLQHFMGVIQSVKRAVQHVGQGGDQRLHPPAFPQRGQGKLAHPLHPRQPRVLRQQAADGTHVHAPLQCLRALAAEHAVGDRVQRGACYALRGQLQQAVHERLYDPPAFLAPADVCAAGSCWLAQRRRHLRQQLAVRVQRTAFQCVGHQLGECHGRCAFEQVRQLAFDPGHLRRKQRNAPQ